MTNNEIIKFLQSKQIPQCGDKIYTADEEYEAYQKAIDALEQQSITTINNDEPITVIYPTIVCDDAISREDALNSLIENTDFEGWELSQALEAIEKLPPVTPQQKYGKWIVHPEIETSTPDYLMFYECSECGDKQCFCKSDIHKKRFCSNCGAKMQESEDKE